MKLTGDFGALASLVMRFSKGGLSTRLQQEGAIEARRQVRRSFAESRDPYGKPWAPLKLRAGAPLRDEGNLAEYTVALSGGGFVLTAGAPYAATHQYGATIKGNPWLTFSVGGAWYRMKQVTIPKRQMVPEGTWGPIWEQAFSERFSSVVRDWFTGD
jgi:phage gpG-like protein